LIAFITVAVAFTCNALIVNFAFNTSFYVNGMSMYPTLNANCLDANGRPLTFHSGTEHTLGYEAEYGYAKSGDRGNWRANLHRYDIVVTFYPNDYQKGTNGQYARDGSGNLILLNGRKSKIKRLIAFPGETIIHEAVTTDDPNGMYNRVWGKTTIISPDGESRILKPLYQTSDYVSNDGVAYNYPTSGGTYSHVTLKEDEYYVMGDNRGYSSDSRHNGPVTAEMLTGKAYLIVGKRVVDSDDLDKVPSYHLLTPWNYRRIG
jgi:signal peptidase I